MTAACPSGPTRAPMVNRACSRESPAPATAGRAARLRPGGKSRCSRIGEAVPWVGTNRAPLAVGMAALDSGPSEPLAHGFPVVDYVICYDSRQLVLEAPPVEGKPRLWLAPFDRR